MNSKCGATLHFFTLQNSKRNILWKIVIRKALTWQVPSSGIHSWKMQLAPLSSINGMCQNELDNNVYKKSNVCYRVYRLLCHGLQKNNKCTSHFSYLCWLNTTSSLASLFAATSSSPQKIKTTVIFGYTFLLYNLSECKRNIIKCYVNKTNKTFTYFSTLREIIRFKLFTHCTD